MGIRQRNQQTAITDIGIIGGGQLAWMMGPAAQKLGLTLHIQTPQATDPAGAIAHHTVLAPVADSHATQRLAQGCQVITFENEFVDLPGLQVLQDQGILFAPRLSALAPLLDKYEQRCYLRQLGLPTPDFVALGDVPWNPGEPVPNPLGFPAVLKARRHGYDGRGTTVVQTQGQLDALVNPVGTEPFLLEAYVPFERELAVMIARSPQGEVQPYTIVETQQRQQVCQVVLAPAAVAPDVATTIAQYSKTLMIALDAVGIFGLELFLTPDGQILVNEVAPRTHNSGHYTLDACHTSQFEQQLRAVAGLPLGDPGLTCGGAVMVNLLGFEDGPADYGDRRAALAALPQAHVYWYGKTESRSGRKLGHVTVTCASLEELQQQWRAIVYRIEALWYGPNTPPTAP
ncbi:5-(carboxyamino)imidazole ribonucleotide synthase [Prochlorothrix hollandica]|uniref:N5-carboxyaminoimidazole ribonucleotide synthase n=1 Tax=Prochlorothrix hollandica PCC 9006 = CALU 1027 TaxID=317619 RepID=A0A0M2PT37_PROHO|nr:5-(carboxyamino)imidazole ribonucleotide synthase [Prochlorothrix hollandica]KKI99690.1 phosphoribosylaminoimidazole carboxylase [Prochlorothrix hollandica PCC 9006 = CALU 1027]